MTNIPVPLNTAAQTGVRTCFSRSFPSCSSTASEMEAHRHILSMITSGISTPEQLRDAIRVMAMDRKMTWGRVVVVAEVTMDLVQRYPLQRDAFFQVLIDYCNISFAYWTRL